MLNCVIWQTDSIDETYKSAAQQLAKKLEQKAKEVSDELAKRQAEKAAEFFKQKQEQSATIGMVLSFQ